MRLVAVPLDYQYHPLQVGYALGHGGAAILIVHHERMSGLEEVGALGAVPRVAVVGGDASVASRRPFDSLLGAERDLPAEAAREASPAVMIYTSGTTSRPKGVVLSHGAISSGVREYLARVTLTADDVTEQCGSTETGPYAMNPPFGRNKPGAIGLPSHGVHVAVVDEHGIDAPTGTVGDIRVSGLGIMDGYWNESAMTRKTLQQGWVQTGDPGRYDEDGYRWFVGRKKDVIVVGGNKVAPLEVEAALTEHPAVRQASVIGVPDAPWGEVPHAYVILDAEGAVRPEDLRTFVADRLAQFMVPAEVHVISEMPSKGPGKVDRELLRMRAITAALIERVPFFKNASSEFLRDIIPRLDARMSRDRCREGLGSRRASRRLPREERRRLF